MCMRVCTCVYVYAGTHTVPSASRVRRMIKSIYQSDGEEDKEEDGNSSDYDDDIKSWTLPARRKASESDSAEENVFNDSGSATDRDDPDYIESWEIGAPAASTPPLLPRRRTSTGTSVRLPTVPTHRSIHNKGRGKKQSSGERLRSKRSARPQYLPRVPGKQLGGNLPRRLHISPVSPRTRKRQGYITLEQPDGHADSPLSVVDISSSKDYPDTSTDSNQRPLHQTTDAFEERSVASVDSGITSLPGERDYEDSDRTSTHTMSSQSSVSSAERSGSQRISKKPSLETRQEEKEQEDADEHDYIFLCCSEPQEVPTTTSRKETENGHQSLNMDKTRSSSSACERVEIENNREHLVPKPSESIPLDLATDHQTTATIQARNESVDSNIEPNHMALPDGRPKEDLSTPNNNKKTSKAKKSPKLPDKLEWRDSNIVLVDMQSDTEQTEPQKMPEEFKSRR
eukprot:scpid72780/ scgid3827/ 